jgi:hypothetical protein
LQDEEHSRQKSFIVPLINYPKGKQGKEKDNIGNNQEMRFNEVLWNEQ